MSGIITLTTDWQNSDYYVGAIKASVISRFPETVFVDITHNIDLFSIQQAAFVIKSSYRNFPDNTIHIIGVDSEPDKNSNIIVAFYNKQYFICNNNGTLGLIFEETPEKSVIINPGTDYKGKTFPELTIFSEIASFVIGGGNISDLGEEVEDVIRFPELLPQLDNNEITGSVIYIDSYSNAITNISKSFFEKYVTGKYEIYLNSNYYKTNKIHLSYKDVGKGDIVCVFNSLGLIEIAIREGKAGLLLNLDRKSIIRIKYNL